MPLLTSEQIPFACTWNLHSFLDFTVLRPIDMLNLGLNARSFGIYIFEHAQTYQISKWHHLSK